MDDDLYEVEPGVSVRELLRGFHEVIDIECPDWRRRMIENVNERSAETGSPWTKLVIQFEFAGGRTQDVTLLVNPDRAQGKRTI